MKLSEMEMDAIPVGLAVKSLMGRPGYVLSVWVDPNYKIWDEEKNPMVEIRWDNGNKSIQPLAFMDSITVII